MFQERMYRKKMGKDRFVTFAISYLETDLWIGVDPYSYKPEIQKYIIDRIQIYRRQLDNYISKRNDFLTSLQPIQLDLLAPSIALKMFEVSAKANVGPMAAVAGTFSEFIGNDVINQFKVNEIIIENGGDIFMKHQYLIDISIYAGKSPLSEKIGIAVPPEYSPLGICTSSATVGPSLSFGKTDATMIVCADAALADAYATTFGNKVRSSEDIHGVLEEIKQNKDIISAVIVVGEKMGMCGQLKLKLFH